MRTHHVLLSTIALCIFASPAFGQKPKATKPPAAAPEPPPPPPAPAMPAAPASLSDSLTGDAKAEYESGKLLFGDGDYAGSLVKFQSSYEHSKDPRLLWNMAACEKNLRHYSKALRLVRRYLKDGDAHLTPDDKREGEELLKVMEPFTAKLKITVNEPGADVSVDDEPLGKSPVDPYVVDIGTRRVVVRKADFGEFSRDVAVGGSAEMKLEVNLAKVAHEGRLTVRAAPEATVVLDGKVIGNGTWSGTVPSGGHMLRVTAPKMRSYQSEIVVQDNQQRDVAVTLEAEPSKGIPGWVWIAGGVVVAGAVATGGYLAVKNAAKEPDARYDGPSGNLTPGIVQASYR